MKLALVHNAQAGGGHLKAEQIIAAFARAGHQMVPAAADGSWEGLIAGGVQRVLIVGGDGTVGAVLPHLVGRQTPFCVLPCGTANNIARSLGQLPSLPEVVAGISNPRVRDLDLGLVRSAAGTQRFIEAVGLGLFVELLQHLKRPEVKAALKPEGPAEQELAKLREYLEAIAKGFPGVECRLSADGEAFSGRFLLAEVMNMKFVGPNLALAPAADPGDGWLDLVLVRVDQRQAVLAHLEGLQRGQVKELPAERRRCREVIFHDLPPAFHVDDEVQEAAAPPVGVGLDPWALTYVKMGGGGERRAVGRHLEDGLYFSGSRGASKRRRLPASPGGSQGAELAS